MILKESEGLYRFYVLRDIFLEHCGFALGKGDFFAASDNCGTFPHASDMRHLDAEMIVVVTLRCEVS